MAKAPPVLSIDFETASTVDLRRSGVYPYARHADTRVLCLAYAFDDKPVQIWRIGDPAPLGVLDHVHRGHPVRAWNAAFEIEIWNYCWLPQTAFGRHSDPRYQLSLDQTYDTMAQAAYYGLPLSLDMAASAARVNVQKDKEGHALMMRMNKPRKVHKDGTMDWWHEDEPDRLDRLCDYCIRDVETERAVADILPPLPDMERRTWIMDRTINARGVGVDLELVRRMQILSAYAKGQLNARMEILTNGEVKTTTSTAALLAHLQARGYPHDNLRKDTVAAHIADPNCGGHNQAVLMLRQAGAKTSTAKLTAMQQAATELPGHLDVGVVRGMLQYYGAFRTGRWAGRLIQLQNLPRGTLGDATLTAADAIMGASNFGPEWVDTFETLFGPTQEAVSSLLRSCIVARPDKTLVVADFAQIEARVLPWLAGETKVLDVFRGGGDVYVQAAAGIYGRAFPPGHKFEKKDVPGDERQVGKVAILALGFGGGKGAFQTMAAAYGVDVPEERAEEIKRRWRDDNPAIVNFWWQLDTAARNAILTPGQTFTAGAGDKIKATMWQGHLVLTLPSGRALVYRDAKLEPHADRPGTTEVTYMGVNQYTNKWERARTYGGKLAENVTQATARDCMRDVMLEAEAAGIAVLLTVHDELITEAPDHAGPAHLHALTQIMSTPPAWALDLPVGADGWHGHRYRK